ncbi:MAG: putative ABC transporter permease [Lachnospiraceae bacterium]|nr:putative ABC transporter permease [Lachnospiraceae bacterium]MDD3614953.1 putative ABC transporter permease [Lachnospiraceae bacterium]
MFIFYQWEIAGIDLYHILAWFFIYSFFGWVWESCYVSFKQRKWINRGFVTGPCLTIYGAGAIGVYMTLKGLPKNIILLYIGGVIVATVLEYVTAVIMESLFHMSWWDYSDKKFNFQGRICLGSSLFWGVMTVALFYVLQPMVESICNLVSVRTGYYILSGIMAVYLVDFTSAFIVASNLSQKVHNWNVMLDEWGDYLKDNVLPEQVDEFKQKLHGAKQYFSDNKALNHLEKRGKEFLESLDIGREQENALSREEFMNKYKDFTDRFMSVRKNNNHIAKRFLHSYPKLGNLTKLRREKENEKYNN